MPCKSKTQKKLCAVEAKKGVCTVPKCALQHKNEKSGRTPVAAPATAAATPPVSRDAKSQPKPDAKAASAPASAAVAAATAAAPVRPLVGVLVPGASIVVKVCLLCHASFEMSTGEQLFFKKNAFKQPLHCKPCRVRRAAAKSTATQPVYGGKLVAGSA